MRANVSWFVTAVALLVLLTIPLAAQQLRYKLIGVFAATVSGVETPLTITSGYPPSGWVGTFYDLRCPLPCFGHFLAGFPVTAAGGVPPYSWSWKAQQGSSLPPGLMFPDMFGYQCIYVRPPAICGDPTRRGTYDVVLTVKDSESPPRYASRGYTIHIYP